jgi:peptidoglycan hydrolase-like protein with peptidoglycan-binding domain
MFIPPPTVVRWRETTPDLATSTIADAQRSLQILGYDVGSADGVFGPQTQAAIAAFQQDRGWDPTGRLDDATLEALSEQAATTAPPRQQPRTPPPQKNAPPAQPASLPVGLPVKNQKGYVTSPHAPHAGLVDIRGFPSGTQVRCPYTQKIFLVP